MSSCKKNRSGGTMSSVENGWSSEIAWDKISSPQLTSGISPLVVVIEEEVKSMRKGGGMHHTRMP